MLSALNPSKLDPLGGLLGGLLYDPYPPRFTQKVLELLERKLPLLARLHPGIRYPMEEEVLHRVVDREGHVVALIGFDKSTERLRLLVEDPWDKARFGGEYGGLYWEDAPILNGVMLVNSTLDVVMCAFPLPVRLVLSPLGENEAEIEAQVTFSGPPGVKLIANVLESLVASIRLPEGLVLASGQSRQQHNALLPQEVAKFRWRLLEREPVEGKIQVAVVAIAKGVDPYPFQDAVGAVASLPVRSLAGELTTLESTTLAVLTIGN